MSWITTVCFVLVAVCVSNKASVSGASWSYEGSTGPDKWADSYPTCGESSQSPITIYEGDATQPGNLGTFTLSNYDTTANVDWTLSNNGHAAVVGLGGSTSITASGGGLTGTFKAAQFHFHWGANDGQGSEHVISAHEFPMELHIVHYNTKYDNISVAMVEPDGLAVLGFMFEVSTSDNANYASIVNNLQNIRTKDESTAIPASPLVNLIPSSLTDFYRYSGSLTTPGCYESVTWTVFKNSIKISAAQLEQFRLLRDSQGSPIVDNYRPPQPLNNREVQASFNPNVHWGYLDNNAAIWKNYYEACGASSQSPISIPSGGSEYDDQIPAFQFEKYDTVEGIDMELSNNGHSIKVGYKTEMPKISGGGLSENYVAAQFHFHWGSSSGMGSEHQIDTTSYPMELHIVHYKSSLLTLGAAAVVPEGLAVLGFFFEVSENDNPALAPLISALSNVREPGTLYNIPTAFTLDSILPPNRADFYRYSGSLTTPGCYESVIWTVFNDKIMISEAQLDVLRSMKSSEKVNNVNVNLVNNFRPVQALNGRVVKRTFQIVSAHWSYEGSHGVNNWYKDYPICGNNGGTSRQSPIDLVPTDVTYQDIDDITFQGYNTPVKLELANNGHSVKASVKEGTVLVSGGGFSDNYKVAQFHFHWGSAMDRGSEHLINTKAYPMELHIVHYGLTYNDLGTAASQPNGLAVLGFMFEISPTDNTNLDPIVNNLDRVINSSSTYEIRDRVSLQSLIPPSLGDFYRYSGSLTTPGCYESVVWTVFRSTIKISARQLEKFRQLLSSEQSPSTNEYVPIVNNYRPPQPINGRVVFANFKLDPDSAIGVKASVLACLICAVLAMIFKH